LNDESSNHCGHRTTFDPSRLSWYQWIPFGNVHARPVPLGDPHASDMTHPLEVFKASL
jgi:hypothetical protein